MAFCGLVVGRRRRADAVRVRRDDGVPGVGLAEEGFAPLSDAGQLPDRHRRRRLAVHRRRRCSSAAASAIVIVTAISTIFLYAAYGVCIYLGATTHDWLNERVWSLGRWSKPVAWVAIFWVVVLMILFSWPTSGNISLAVHADRPSCSWSSTTSAGRGPGFKGPQVMGAEAELTEIEREFEQAAEHLERPPRPRPVVADAPRAGAALVASEGRPVHRSALHRSPADSPRGIDDEQRQPRPRKHPRLEELEAMVRDGQIDTLIVALTDMQGRLMGKRVQGQAFLNGVIDHGAHFCTYLLGTDMEMNTPDGFRLMNWETGYGDWIADPVWDTLRVLPWLEKTALVLSDTIDRGDPRGDPDLAPDDPQAPGRARPPRPGFASRPAPSSSTTSCKRQLGGHGRATAAPVPQRVRATTTRTTTCSRRPRPSRSTGCCATR